MKLPPNMFLVAQVRGMVRSVRVSSMAALRNENKREKRSGSDCVPKHGPKECRTKETCPKVKEGALPGLSDRRGRWASIWRENIFKVPELGNLHAN